MKILFKGIYYEYDYKNIQYNIRKQNALNDIFNYLLNDNKKNKFFIDMGLELKKMKMKAFELLYIKKWLEKLSLNLE